MYYTSRLQISKHGVYSNINKNNEKYGKWILFFNKTDYNRALEICNQLIADNITEDCEISSRFDTKAVVVGIFADASDKKANKKIIKYLRDNNLINKCKNGKYINIGFKFLADTLENTYYSATYDRLGPKQPEQCPIKASDYMCLATGQIY